MKTSNKILLGAALTGFLVITGIHVAIYAKYRTKDFSKVKKMVPASEKHMLPGIKYVKLNQVPYCLIAPSDTLRMEMEKNSEQALRWYKQHDTLIIDGRLFSEEGEAITKKVGLYLPDSVHIMAEGSWVLLAADFNKGKKGAYRFTLSNQCHLSTIERFPEDTELPIASLQIDSDDSEIKFRKTDVIDELRVTAKNSNISNKAVVHHLYLDIDAATSLTVNGNSLKDVHIAPKQ